MATKQSNSVLGIDIGGTGIKGAPVDVTRGVLLAERLRLETPRPATPAAVVTVVKALIRELKWKGPVGCTFPSVVKRGVLCTAANIDQSWIGVNAEALLKRRIGLPVTVLNDADAAGLAEMEFGVGKRATGVTALVTLGTGIGTALFYRGVLIPNSELGHLIIDGKDAELRASNRVREEKELSWKKWGKRVNDYLQHLERLVWPDLIVIGGGVSKKFEEFSPYLSVRARVVPAKLLNDAGIIGAALATRRPYY